MFELFDQFIYISIMMFGAYITLYIKNRSYAGILLIACSILSNILIFSIILNPFVFITLPITAVLLLRDFMADFKTGIVTRKHKIGAIIAAVIVCYDGVFILKLSHFNLSDSISLFMIGSIIGTVTGFYLVIYPFKEMMAERAVNLEALNNSNNNMQLEADKQELLGDAAQDSVVITEQNNTVDSGLNHKSAQVKNPKVFGVDSIYIIVGLIILAVLFGTIFLNLVSRTVIDMKDYVFVTVDPDAVVDAKVGYYASFEHFDSNNFYTDLIETGSEYGLTQEEIEQYTPSYTTEDAEMWKKLDIKVANNLDVVNNGDVVTTNITYNEKYAAKNNIVIENTNFQTEIDTLPEGITDSSSVDIKELKQLAVDAVANSKYGKKYNLDNPVDYAWYDDGTSEYLKYTITFDGQAPGLLGLKDDTVMFIVTPYLQNGELNVADDVSLFDQTKLK